MDLFLMYQRPRLIAAVFGICVFLIAVAAIALAFPAIATSVGDGFGLTEPHWPWMSVTASVAVILSGMMFIEEIRGFFLGMAFSAICVVVITAIVQMQHIE